MRGFPIKCKAPRYPLLRKRANYSEEELKAQQSWIDRSIRSLERNPDAMLTVRDGGGDE